VVRRRGGISLHSLSGLGRYALVVLVLLAVAMPGDRADRAEAARPLDVGFADTLYEDPATSKRWLKQTESVNADIIRINMYWSQVAFNRPRNPRDPLDPDYNWGLYDAAIANAANRGFEVDLTVLLAPAWAEGPGRPNVEKAPFGSWKPDPGAFGDFAHALAERYNGTFVDDGRTLPRVRYFEAWNEPNLSTYITPQFQGGKNKSAAIYVKLLNRFHDEIKAVMPKAEIVTGGTAPYGDPPGPRAMKTGPLRFARELLCLDSRLRRSTCAGGERAKFDIYAHHPINREDPPTAHGPRADDVQIADFGDLTKTVRRAEKLNTIGTKGRHGLWANEVWWQTNPPDRDEGVPPKIQARWMSQALYLLWKQGASNVSFLQFRDARYKAGEYTLDSYQTGVYTFRGQRKPSADAVAFPFVTERRGKSRLLAWGIAPRSGKLTIEARVGSDGAYIKLRTLKVKAGRIFTAPLRLRGEAQLRAVVGKSASIPWSEEG